MGNLKKNKLKIFAAAICLTFGMTTQAQTVVNGFFPKQKDLTVAISSGFKSNSDFYRGRELFGGNPGNLNDIETSVIGLYAEYGITDWLSATATLPYITVKSADGEPGPLVPSGKAEGLQDLGLYLKGKIYEKQGGNGAAFKFGSAISYSFPISDYEGGGVLSIGNQANNFSGTLITQYMLPFGLFAEVQGGYSFRSSSDFDIPNATIFTGKLGYCNKYFYVDTVLGVQNSQSGIDIGTPEFEAAGGPSHLPETDVDYTELSFNAYVPFYKNMFGASAGYTTTLTGRNFNDASGFSLGLVYTLR